MKTPMRRLAVLGLALALASCSSLLGGGGAGPKLYILTPATDFPPNLPSLPAQLLIQTPEASDVLNTRQIALSRNTLSFDYFASANWTDSAPTLVQKLLVDSFENSGHLTGVARDTVALKGDFVLRSELRHFEADYGKDEPLPTVRVELGLTLVRLPDRDIVGHRTVIATAKPGENSVPAVVVAFDQALDAALRDSVAWTLATAKP